ncbi:MAG: RluA family pseudouridine synthase [Cytophagales bacterium]|nr:RluA family pseudouridine synthase [Cytophagales bacterium]
MKILLHSHKTPSNYHLKTRLLDYLQEHFADYLPSRNATKKAIKKGLVMVNDKEGSQGDWVKKDQKIELFEEEKQSPIFELSFPVVYEDEYLAVINKPAGIEVSGNKFRTIQNALLFNINISSEIDALKVPKPVHRLDYATSGLLMIAKTKKMLIELGSLFSEKKIKKCYQAILTGKLGEKKGFINTPINEQEALTEYEVIKEVPSLKTGFLTLVNYYPHTGRTHQLRIHSLEQGMPILGDKIYGDQEKVFQGKGMFLSAIALTFTHPVTFQEMKLEIEAPAKFQKTLERQKNMWEKKL